MTRKGLLGPSKLGHILDDVPGLGDYTLDMGAFVQYKGRGYCWVEASGDGTVRLSREMMERLGVAAGDELMCIRSSDIAFTLGHHGPLFERAENYQGDIPVY